MGIACWERKAANRQSKYLIFSVFTLQQWLKKRDSMLRSTYFARLVFLRSGTMYPGSTDLTLQFCIH